MWFQRRARESFFFANTVIGKNSTTLIKNVIHGTVLIQWTGISLATILSFTLCKMASSECTIYKTRNLYFPDDIRERILKKALNQNTFLCKPVSKTWANHIALYGGNGYMVGSTPSSLAKSNIFENALSSRDNWWEWLCNILSIHDFYVIVKDPMETNAVEKALEWSNSRSVKYENDENRSLITNITTYEINNIMCWTLRARLLSNLFRINILKKTAIVFMSYIEKTQEWIETFINMENKKLQDFAIIDDELSKTGDNLNTEYNFYNLYFKIEHILNNFVQNYKLRNSSNKEIILQKISNSLNFIKKSIYHGIVRSYFNNVKNNSWDISIFSLKSIFHTKYWLLDIIDKTIVEKENYRNSEKIKEVSKNYNILNVEDETYLQYENNRNITNSEINDDEKKSIKDLKCEVLKNEKSLYKLYFYEYAPCGWFQSFLGKNSLGKMLCEQGLDGLLPYERLCIILKTIGISAKVERSKILPIARITIEIYQ